MNNLLPAPALRTGRQYPARTAVSSLEWLQWYLCPAQRAFHQLVLRDGSVPLAHWVLPAGPAVAAVTELLAGVWLRVPPALGLTVPSATQAIGRGTCRAVGSSRQAFSVAPGTVPSSLLLHLEAAGAAGLYTLRQLRPGGQSWLLGKPQGIGRPHAEATTRQSVPREDPT